MTITVERMVAVLEAKVDQFEKNIASARVKAVGDFTAITTAGTKMEASVARLGASGKKGFDTYAKGARIAGGETANLAAQLQDIAVQLQSGTNPFTVALQQGTQINQILGQAGMRGALGALGGAFTSLINPVSLATIAIITLGGLAVQYFGDLISGGQDSKKTLEEQATLIGKVAEQWGNAVPELKDYVDQLKRAKDVADLQAAGGIKISEDQASINAALDEFIQKNEEVVDAINRAFDATGRSDASLSKFAASWLDLEQKVRAGTATQDDFSEATKLLRGAVADSGGDLDAFGTQFETISGRIMNALDALQQFQQRMRDALAQGISTQAQIQNLTTGQINNPNLPDPNFRLPGTGPVPESRPLVELEGFDKVTSAARKQSDAFADANKSLEERTKSLQAQLAVQQQLNPLVNDYGYALEFAKAKQDLLTAAEKGKRELTPQLAADIDKVSAAYARTSAELAKLAEQNKKAADAIAFQKDLVNGALSDMRTALEDGKLSWQDLGNVAVNVLNKIADRLQQMLVDQLFAKGFVGLFGSLGGIAGGIVGGVSGAGGVGAGAISQAAGISSAPRIPNVAAARAGAQNVHVTVGVSADGNGNIRPFVENVSRTEAARSGRLTLEQYRRNQLHLDIDSHGRNPRARGRI